MSEKMGTCDNCGHQYPLREMYLDKHFALKPWYLYCRWCHLKFMGGQVKPKPRMA